MIRKRPWWIWPMLAGVLALCGQSSEAKGFYFGASLGQTDARDLDLGPVADGSLLTGGTDGIDSGWKFFGGIKVLRFMNVEFDYRDYGQTSFSAMSDGTGTIYSAGPIEGLADTKAVGVTAVIVIPAGRLKLFGKGGLARWRSDLTIRHSMGNIATSDSDGVDTMYGAGLAWALKGSIGIRVEYERIVTDVADRDYISAGVNFRY
jgi:hypothetical protein